MRYPKVRFSLRTLLIVMSLIGTSIVVWPLLWTQWAVYSVTKNVDREGGDYIRPAATELSEHGAKSIPAFVRLLQHEDFYVRQVAAEMLGVIEPNAMSDKALMQASRNDEDWRVRLSAIVSYLRFDSFTEQRVPLLVELLADQHPQVQAFVIQALGLLAEEGANTVGAIPALEKIVADEPLISIFVQTTLEKMEQSSIAEVRKAAKEALARM